MGEVYTRYTSRLASCKCCDTADREPVFTVVVVRVGVTTIEVQVPRVVIIVLCTAPVVAVVTTVVQRTIVVVPVAGRRKRKQTLLS
jgi:hypothetical protein